MSYEYKVVPAPTRGQKGKGVKGSEGRFANALELHMNTLAAEGWEFMRAETLPHEERSGLTSTTTTYRTVFVYRRAATSEEPAEPPVQAPTAEPADVEAEGKTSPTEREVATDETAQTDQSEKTDVDASEDDERDQDEVVQAGVKSLKKE